MKLLQINAVNAVSSTGRTTAELSEGLRRLGHECITLHSQGPTSNGALRIGGTVGRKLHALLSRLTGLQGYYSRHSTRALLEVLDRFSPDVVRLGNLHGNFVNLPMLFDYLASNDIPTVVTLDDCWFYTGKCTHYTLDRCDRWMRECGKCPRLRKDIPSWLFDRTRKMRRDKELWFQAIPRLAVVGVSEWITSEAGRSLLRSARITTRIYNWVDLDVFKPASSSLRESLGIGGTFAVVGVASSWSVSKGLLDFIALSRELGVSTSLILVGRIQPNVHLPEEIIHIPGTDNPEQLAELYSMADVFLNLSKEESFGKVTAEALACGTPVITVRGTANAELVGPGCGLVIEGADPSHVLEAIATIRRRGSSSYSATCVRFARDNFAMVSGIEKYERVFLELLETQST